MPFLIGGTFDGGAPGYPVTLKCGNTTAATVGMLFFVNTAGAAEPWTATITHAYPWVAVTAAATAQNFTAYPAHPNLILRTTSSSTVVTLGTLYTCDLSAWQCGTTAATATTNTLRVMPIRQHDTAAKVAGTAGTLYDVLLFPGNK